MATLVVHNFAANWIRYPSDFGPKSAGGWIDPAIAPSIFPKDSPLQRIPFVLRFQVLETKKMTTFVTTLKKSNFVVTLTASAINGSAGCEIAQVTWDAATFQYHLLALSPELDPQQTDWKAIMTVTSGKLSAVTPSTTIVP